MCGISDAQQTVGDWFGDWAMEVFLVTLVLAKTLDRSVGLLVDDLHVAVPLYWKALRSAFEEWFELALSMLLLLGLFQHRAAGSAQRP